MSVATSVVLMVISICRSDEWHRSSEVLVYIWLCRLEFRRLESKIQRLPPDVTRNVKFVGRFVSISELRVLRRSGSDFYSTVGNGSDSVSDPGAPDPPDPSPTWIYYEYARASHKSWADPHPLVSFTSFLPPLRPPPSLRKLVRRAPGCPHEG